MSSPFFPISPKEHRDHGWKRQDHYRFAAGESYITLVLAELTSALPHYALAFSARPGGGFHLVALLAVHEGENLYLDGGSGLWRAEYVPSHLRAYPFSMGEVPTGDKISQVLCFYRGSGLYREAPDPAQGEERFFDDEGRPQPFLQKVIEFLQAITVNRKLTDRAVDALAEAGLLVPWALPNPDPARPLLQGLHRIDEAALNALDAGALKALQEVHAMPVAYAQLLSMPRIRVLKRLYEMNRAATQQPQAAVMPESIGALFGAPEKDDLKFDWSSL